MTREEEIQKLIDEETDIDNYGSFDYQIGVCDGVRLADKTMIEQACEYLSIYYPNIDRMGIDAFIEQFKKDLKKQWRNKL